MEPGSLMKSNAASLTTSIILSSA